MKKYILGFNVPVKDTVFNKFLKTLANLFQVLNRLSFSEMLCLSYSTLEITAITKLLDNIVIVRSLQDIDKSNYSLAFKSFNDLDFRHESIFDVFILIN